MITLGEINAIANRFQVPAETIEKDYMISWILLCLTKSKIINDFIFYGGTAIKRIYFEEHRFSEDIDLLSAANFTSDDLLEKLNILDYAREEANISLNADPSSIIQTKDRIQMLIRYSGYEEIVGAPKEIRIDFSMDMELYGESHLNCVNSRKFFYTALCSLIPALEFHICLLQSKSFLKN